MDCATHQAQSGSKVTQHENMMRVTYSLLVAHWPSPTHFTTWNISKLSRSFFCNTSLLLCNNSGESSKLLFGECLTVSQHQKSGQCEVATQYSLPTRPSLPLCLFIYPSEDVTYTRSHSFAVSVFWMTAAVTPPDKLFAKKDNVMWASSASCLDSPPDQPPPLAMCYCLSAQEGRQQ